MKSFSIKVFISFLIILSVVCFCGCVDPDSDTTSQTEQTTQETTQEVTETTAAEDSDNEEYYWDGYYAPSDEEIDNAMLQDAYDAYDDYMYEQMGPGDSYEYPYF